MIKEFFKQSAIYTVASVVGRGVSFLLLPFYTRVLTPTDYGTVDILTIFNAFIGVTIALEISQGVARYSADAGSPAERSRYISTAFWFTLIMLTVFALVCSLFARPLTQLVLGSADLTAAFQLTVFSTWSYGCLYFAQNQLRWQLQPKLFAFTSLAVLFVSIGSTIYLVLVQRLGVVGVIGGQLLGNSAGAALALYWVRDLLTWTFDWKKFKEMLGFSVPLIPSSMGVVLFTYIDRLAVRELMSVADVGLLGIGYRLASSVGWVMVGFQSAMTPLIYSKYREAATPGAIARIFRYFVAFTLLIFLFQALFAPEILTFFTTPPYYAAAQVIPLLIPSIILAQMYIFAPGLSLAKKTGAIAVINIAGALLNTALNFALIPYLGISGAAAATLVTTATIFAAYMVYSQRLYFVPHAWKQLGLATVIVVGLLLLGIWVEIGFWGNVLFKALLWLGGAAALIWIGLVEPAVFAQVRGQVYTRLPGRRGMK